MQHPYHGLQGILTHWKADIDAAELHGQVVGLLSGGKPASADGPAVAAALGLTEQLGEATSSEVARIVGALAAASEAALADEQLGFQPLLPDDEQALDERVGALLQWSRGFLAGLGLSGFKVEGQAQGVDEFLADLSTIAASSIDALDGDEESEVAYMELLEFLRMGTLLVHLSSRREAA
ncbi:MAG: UPF0149 family protein [Xanthomonadales bacterium]|nr:UPF0149 family protein [Xanthomonadales bacterium]MCB1642781.1 UPF0149 family protein [Xanthomonadales bacterium]